MASLNVEELRQILKITNDYDLVLEQSVAAFIKYFPVADHFRVCCGLSLLIYDSILLNKQRLVAAVLLCGVNRSEVEYANPYLSVLLDMVESYSTNTIEKSILTRLLRSNKYYNEIIKKTVSQVYAEFSAKEANELDRNEIAHLRSKFEEHGHGYTAYDRLAVPSVVSISNYQSSVSFDDILTGNAIESNREDLYGKLPWTEEELLEEARTLEAFYGKDNFLNNMYAPKFEIFCPPILDFQEGELSFWMPDLSTLLPPADDAFFDSIMKIAMDNNLIKSPPTSTALETTTTATTESTTTSKSPDRPLPKLAPMPGLTAVSSPKGSTFNTPSGNGAVKNGTASTGSVSVPKPFPSLSSVDSNGNTGTSNPTLAVPPPPGIKRDVSSGLSDLPPGMTRIKPIDLGLTIPSLVTLAGTDNNNSKNTAAPKTTSPVPKVSPTVSTTQSSIDTGSEFTTADREELTTLLSSAIANTLGPKQLSRLIALVKAGGASAVIPVLTPEKLPNLVESNWSAAVQCVIQIVRDANISSPFNNNGNGKLNASQQTMFDYLRVFESGDMTFHAIEAFNGLNAEIDLPSEFTHRYMNKCMSACEHIKDKFSQSRFVRLVCAVLQSLIRKKSTSFHMRGMFPEIQTFCLTFAKIKETIALFGVIRGLEQNG